MIRLSLHDAYFLFFTNVHQTNIFVSNFFTKFFTNVHQKNIFVSNYLNVTVDIHTYIFQRNQLLCAYMCLGELGEVDVSLNERSQ